MAGIPGFIYADDLEEYIVDRGDLMFDMYQLPFLVAVDNDELVERIGEFDEEKYKRDVEEFMKEVGNMEDGKASERVVNVIKRKA